MTGITKLVIELSGRTRSLFADSWYMGIDSWYMSIDIQGKKRKHLDHAGGIPLYEKECRDVFSAHWWTQEYRDASADDTTISRQLIDEDGLTVSAMHLYSTCKGLLRCRCRGDRRMYEGNSIPHILACGLRISSSFARNLPRARLYATDAENVFSRRDSKSQYEMAT